MRKTTLTLSLTSVAFACLVLSGCATTHEKVTADAAVASKQIEIKRNQLKESITLAESNRINAQDVQKPFIAGNSRPLARDVDMPEILRKPTPVTALFQRNAVDLPTAMQQLSLATGISITATADALMPASAFVSKTGGAGASPVSAPTRVVLQAQDKPLWALLDDVARQASISWRPVQGGAEFYRVETKIFYLSAIPQVANTSASLGRNGGANAAFDSQSKSSFETKDQNLVKGIFTTVDALLTTGGKATLGNENQTIVVTDTKGALERVESFVREQNKIMSRRVRVLIEAIEVVDKDNSEIGVDWNILYRTATEVINITPTATLTGTQAGSISFFDVNKGNTSGSAAVIKALNEIGTVVNRRSFPFLTTSGRPVTQALRSTFNYVDQVQATAVASSTQAAQAPTVVQKDETVGTFVTLMPTAKSDGTIFLSIAFDTTTAQPLVPFTVGSSTSSVTVQQKTIDGTGVIQEVPVRSGQTVVIGGIETQTSQSTLRRLANGAPMLLGGSDSSKMTKTRMVLLVTAVTEEGV